MRQLKKEGKNGLPPSGVGGVKLFDVVPVLPQGPNRHLVEAGESEKTCNCRLGHDGEENPGEDFVGVIGTGNTVEKPGEGVACSKWDFPDPSSSRPKVSEAFVDEEVS